MAAQEIEACLRPTVVAIAVAQSNFGARDAVMIIQYDQLQDQLELELSGL